jgi:steroid 5-alpha reductase family enzyme
MLPITGSMLWLAYITSMFILVHLKKDMSIGNFTWGGGVLLITLYTFFAYSTGLPRQLLVTLLIFIWCVRLSIYVFIRYCKGQDPRYLSWQLDLQQWIRVFIKSFIWIFILNGGFSLLMSLPSSIVNLSTTPGLTTLDFLALLCWSIGFYFESVSDYQLFRFLKNPANRGSVLQSGLWRYSRHPNYFGEIVMWWSIWLFALHSPYGLFTIIAPTAITFSLVFVTGIPWLEQAMASNPAYQEYKKRTSMLIPWWPKF